jgi:hypothetical protein
LTKKLDAYTINKAYGGALPDHDGCLGMHQHTLSVGDTQSFIIKPTDMRLFWLTVEERELNRHDHLLPPLPEIPQTRNKTISELLSERARFCLLNDRHQYWWTELQELART